MAASHNLLSPQNIPEEMLDLTSELRHKAIDIANTMLGDGYTLPVAITLATARVRNWAGLSIAGTPAHHVVPHPDGWAIIRADGDKPSHVTGTKQEAVDKARDIARNQKTRLVIHGQDGLVQTEHEYTD